jgi:signal transduction histidine kinase
MSQSATAVVKVLLVDDLEENLTALEALLADPALELLKARSGEAALELLLIHDVALALLDVQMPGMDGFELAELMRGTERTRHVPIIFVTAGAHEQQRVFRGYDAGAVDFLFKPIDPHMLRHKVDTFVELHRQRLQLAAQVEQIKKLNAELSDTLALNERFVAAVGHDLRTPLNNVTLATATLMPRLRDDQDRRLLERVRVSAQRMGKMIDELFDLARARQSGGIPVTPEDDVDLLQVSERVVAELTQAPPERTIEVRHRGDLRGRWDATRLSQVISNLLTNALRHGARDCPVSLELDGTRAREVTLEVENRGEISPDALPTLFEPFRRGATRRSNTEGLGLGLFIVQQVVRAHGGEVRADCARGCTRFRVTLPRRARGLEEPVSRAAAGPQLASSQG